MRLHREEEVSKPSKHRRKFAVGPINFSFQLLSLFLFLNLSVFLSESFFIFFLSNWSLLLPRSLCFSPEIPKLFFFNIGPKPTSQSLCFFSVFLPRSRPKPSVSLPQSHPKLSISLPQCRLRTLFFSLIGSKLSLGCGPSSFFFLSWTSRSFETKRWEGNWRGPVLVSLPPTSNSHLKWCSHLL